MNSSFPICSNLPNFRQRESTIVIIGIRGQTIRYEICDNVLI